MNHCDIVASDAEFPGEGIVSGGGRESLQIDRIRNDSDFLAPQLVQSRGHVLGLHHNEVHRAQLFEQQSDQVFRVGAIQDSSDEVAGPARQDTGEPVSSGQVRNVPGKGFPSDDDHIRSFVRDQNRDRLPNLLALQPSVITGSRDTGRDVEVREQDPRHAQARMAESKSVTGLARLRGDWSHGAYHMTQVRKTDKELRARDRRPARVRRQRSYVEDVKAGWRWHELLAFPKRVRIPIGRQGRPPDESSGPLSEDTPPWTAPLKYNACAVVTVQARGVCIPRESGRAAGARPQKRRDSMITCPSVRR